MRQESGGGSAGPPLGAMVPALSRSCRLAELGREGPEVEREREWGRDWEIGVGTGTAGAEVDTSVPVPVPDSGE